MSTVSKTSDVFISHAISDREIASDVAHALDSAGLTSFHIGLVEAGNDLSKEIWEALSESRALIAIISPETANYSMGMIEIGAAAAWNKPVFLLINGPSSTRIPAALQNYSIYPLNRLDEVVHAIKSGFEPLSQSERDSLADIYSQLNLPTDQLSQSPSALRDLTVEFNARSGKQFSGERILSELLRLRKKGKLPRLRSKGPLAG
jgi:hypothetical protein